MPRIQHKRGTSANLASVNPTPLAGELVWDSTENAIKIGDGATAWSSLAYVTATPRTHAHDGADITTGTVAYARLPVGSTTSTVCAGDDARLTDARTPTAHKASHATGGSDALSPSDIGAAPAASPTFTGTVTVSAGTAAAPAIVASGDSNTGAFFPAADTFAISTAGVERVRVDSSGYVGIGVGTPLRPLHIVTSGIAQKILLYDATGDAYIQMANATTGNTTSDGLLVGVQTSSGDAIINNREASNTRFFTNSAERVRISSSGNVGIGTGVSSPASRLDVSGVITVSATSGSAGSYLPSVTFSGDPNTGFGQVSGQSDTASVFTAGHERVRVTSSGTVGIGTASIDSGVTLDTRGTIQAKAAGVKIQAVDSSVIVKAQASNATSEGIVGTESNHNLAIRANNVAALRVKTTGAVRFVPLSADPASGEVGDIYYNSTMGTLRTYRGSSWVSVPPRPWDISNGVLTHEFSVSGQETQPIGIAFKPDGSKMYICGSTGDDVNEYDLATPWDISTATYLQNFSVSAKDSFPTGVVFRPNGLKMYVLGASSDSVHEYDLSAAWDVTSATFLQSFSVSSQDTTPHGLVFKPDGLKFYICGTVSDSVHEYTMSTAWDISTATFSQSLSISAQDAQSAGLAFRPDGLRMYMTGYTTDTTNEYILSTAWDISTAAYTQRISIADTIPAGTAFSADGTRMYVAGYTGQKVLQYWLA